MPLLKISLTESIPDSARNTAISDAISIVAEVTGKPESVVMMKMEEGCQLTLGEHSEKVALLEVRGIEYPREKTHALTNRLCDWAENYLSIPSERVFVIADDVPRGYWGNNRKVF